jgi:hypothetical protein
MKKTICTNCGKEDIVMVNGNVKDCINNITLGFRYICLTCFITWVFGINREDAEKQVKNMKHKGLIKHEGIDLSEED